MSLSKASASPSRRLAARLRVHLPEARHALRVTIGTLLAFALYEALELPQGYWAVFTVVIVMQGSVGGTVGVAVDRMIGTIAGALVGGAAAALRGPGPEALGLALAISIALTSLLAAVRPNMKVAPVTAAIMLLSATGKLTPLDAAGFRVLEIALGSVIAVAVTLVVLPAKSRAAVAAGVSAAAALIAELLEGLADALRDGRAYDDPGLHDRLRAALSALEAAMVDAERQRTAFLGDHGVPQAVLRSLWRVRNDGVSIGRALGEAFPKIARPSLVEPAEADLRAKAAQVRASAAALAGGRGVEPGEAAAAHMAFLAAFDGLRAEGHTRALTFADAGRVFGLAFALESLHRDAADLAQRVGETASGRAPPAPPAAPVGAAPA